jgi:hypothetical protein
MKPLAAQCGGIFFPDFATLHPGYRQIPKISWENI